MNRVILIKYGELTTKRIIVIFYKILENNIKEKLSNYNIEIKEIITECLYMRKMNILMKL